MVKKRKTKASANSSANKNRNASASSCAHKKLSPASHKSLDHLMRYYEGHEAVYIFRREHLLSQEGFLVNILLDESALQRRKSFTSMHQRWRYGRGVRVGNSVRPGLQIKYSPNVTELVSGSLAISATANLDATTDNVTNPINYMMSGGPHKVFKIDKPMTWTVPAEMLVGLTNDGWFYSSATSATPQHRAPCRLLLAQLGDVTTPADATALATMDVLGTFTAHWTVECYAQLPALARVPGAEAEVPVASVTPTETPVDPLSLHYESRDVSVPYIRSVTAGGDTYSTVDIDVDPAELVALVGQNAASDYFRRLNGGEELFNDGGHLYGAGVVSYRMSFPVIHYNGDGPLYHAEEATRRAFVDYVHDNGERRSLSDLGGWIMNKINDITHFLFADRGRGVSVWNVAKDVGLVLVSLLAARDDAESAMHTVIRNALANKANAGNTNAGYVLEALDSVPGYGIQGFGMGISPNSPSYGDDVMDDDDRAGISSVYSAMLQGTPVQTLKWESQWNGQTVYFPGATNPPDRAFRTRAVRSVPSLAKASGGQIVASYHGFGQIGWYTSVVQVDFFSHLVNASGENDRILMSAWPRYDSNGDFIDTIDLNTNAYIWHVDVRPRCYSTVQYGTAGTGRTLAGWLGVIEANGSSGYVSFGLDASRNAATADNSATEGIVFLSGIDSAGVTLQSWSGMFPNALPGMSSAGFVYADVSATCYQIFAPRPAAETIISRSRRPVYAFKPASLAASSSAAQSSCQEVVVAGTLAVAKPTIGRHTDGATPFVFVQSDAFGPMLCNRTDHYRVRDLKHIGSCDCVCVASEPEGKPA